MRLSTHDHSRTSFFRYTIPWFSSVISRFYISSLNLQVKRGPYLYIFHSQSIPQKPIREGEVFEFLPKQIVLRKRAMGIFAVIQSEDGIKKTGTVNTNWIYWYLNQTIDKLKRFSRNGFRPWEPNGTKSSRIWRISWIYSTNNNNLPW